MSKKVSEFLWSSLTALALLLVSLTAIFILASTYTGYVDNLMFVFMAGMAMCLTVVCVMGIMDIVWSIWDFFKEKKYKK